MILIHLKQNYERDGMKSSTSLHIILYNPWEPAVSKETHIDMNTHSVCRP